MNSLFEQIAEEAFVLVPQQKGLHVRSFSLEKFAELIVMECTRVPYNMWDNAELNADIAIKIENRIKEHFGIEE